MNGHPMHGLEDLFRARFGAGPVHAVRAPGRVNLIGDHTDYNGLPVFPMALQREIRVAFRARGDRRVRLASTGAFEKSEFEIGPAIPAEPPGDWSNYGRAAAQALASIHPHLGGIDALVWGDIPQAAGLSSSSALVVASAIALLAANRLPWDPGALAALLARGERYVGTRGGGMDQTVCLCARQGHALRIGFTPFAWTPVPVPPDWVFLVGNSLVVADKSLGARERYNATPARCREALERSGLGASYPEAMAGRPLPDLLAEAGRKLGGNLLGAFRHVVTEAARVDRAEAAMRAGDLGSFGAAMNASHDSLSRDLEVSCPQLDELVAAFLSAGAAGARVTGAGFGGCVVALCERTRAEAVAGSVQRAFYEPRGADADQHLFAAEPAAGAGIIA